MAKKPESSTFSCFASAPASRQGRILAAGGPGVKPKRIPGGLCYHLSYMTYADAQTAQKTAQSLYGATAQITVIDHGYDNLVVLVDGRYALRFPRNSNALITAQYEKFILSQLGAAQVGIGAGMNSVSLPIVSGEGTDPAYFVTPFIAGRHLTIAEITALPEAEQQQVGREIATFMHAMHSVLPMTTVVRARADYKLHTLEEEAWDKYLDKMLGQTTFPTPAQDAIAKKYYELWKTRANTQPTIAIHDDLHTDNLMFEKGKLVGVLDFGDTNVGTFEQEMRQLYRIGMTVLEAAVNTYRTLSGKPIDIEVVKVWAIVQELAAYSQRLNDMSHPSFARAVKHLQKWLPEGGWGK